MNNARKAARNVLNLQYGKPVFLCFFFIFLYFGCKPNVGNEVRTAISGITVEPKKLTLTIGSTGTLTAIILPETATDTAVTWSSNNDGIAAVDENGKVTAKSAGTVAITVTTKDGGKQTTATIQVLPLEVKDGKLVKYTGTDADVEIPDTVKVIGKGAFARNKAVKEVKLPSGLLEIEAAAFFDSSLTKITIPASVTKIGNRAFMKSGVTDIEFASGSTLAELSESFCQACNNLTKVVLPEGLQSVGKHAFESCNKLTDIHLPDSVHTIKIEAFRETGLQTVTLPANLQKLEQQAFYRNKELNAVQASTTPFKEEWVTIQDNGISAYCFLDNTKLKTIVLPNRVTTLLKGAFFGVLHLKELTLPVSIGVINEHVIDVRSENVVLHVKGDNPATINIKENSFIGEVTKLSIRVPKGKGQAFKDADGWKKYADKISEENENNN